MPALVNVSAATYLSPMLHGQEEAEDMTERPGLNDIFPTDDRFIFWGTRTLPDQEAAMTPASVNHAEPMPLPAEAEVTVLPQTDPQPELITEEYAGIGNLMDLPFLNLDPYEPKDNPDLPEAMLRERHGGGITTSADTAIRDFGFGVLKGTSFDLEMTNHRYWSDDIHMDIHLLTDQRSTEIEFYDYGGKSLPFNYQSSTAVTFSGVAHANEFGSVMVQFEAGTAEAFELDGYDTDGNPIFSWYDFEEVLWLTGQSYADGTLYTFSIEYEFSFEIEWLTPEVYDISMSVHFFGQIGEHLGPTRQYWYDDKFYFDALDLNEVQSFEFPQEFYNVLDQFQTNMGSSWDALNLVDDHLGSIFQQLRDDNHYSELDELNDWLTQELDIPIPDPWI